MSICRWNGVWLPYFYWMCPDAATDSEAGSADPPDGVAVIIGASGGIGGALARELARRGAFAEIVSLSRPLLDLADEASIVACASDIAGRGPLRLVIVASGVLHGDDLMPEKSWRDLDPARLARIFAVNTIGPALIIKHFAPLLAREGRAVFATLSARVGSIGDNHLGGWYGYRSSKAALNQIVRTGAVELRRTHPEAVCVALHPGTVATRLSQPFAKKGLDVQAPEVAATRLIDVIERLRPEDTGGFFDHHAKALQW